MSVTTEWCDEADGAYIVVCSTHGVVDYGPSEADAESKASDHRATHVVPEGNRRDNPS